MIEDEARRVMIEPVDEKSVRGGDGRSLRPRLSFTFAVSSSSGHDDARSSPYLRMTAKSGPPYQIDAEIPALRRGAARE